MFFCVFGNTVKIFVPISGLEFRCTEWKKTFILDRADVVSGTAK